MKIEMANLKPDIYLLHDIIRDSDIEFIKNLAVPRVRTFDVLFQKRMRGSTAVISFVFAFPVVTY